MEKERTLQDRLKDDLKDIEFRKVFDEEEDCASLAIQIAKLRQQ